MPKLCPKLGVTTKQGLQLLPKQGLMKRRRRWRVGVILYLGFLKFGVILLYCATTGMDSSLIGHVFLSLTGAFTWFDFWLDGHPSIDFCGFGPCYVFSLIFL